VLALAGAGLVGVVVTLLLVAAWAVFVRGDDSPETASGSGLAALSASPATQAPVVTGVTPASRPVVTRLSRCVAAERDLQGPLAAARPALDQWEVHVGAMNKLVVGEITLQQAMDFWNQTRLGAQRKLARFREAMRALRHRGVDCPSPDLLAPDARASRCARQVQAEVRVLHAAQVSVGTWGRHVRDMDMLRMGHLSPQDATRMWLSLWQRGVRDLRSYHQAVREAGSQHGCALAGG
jgi:hypothetical protein